MHLSPVIYKTRTSQFPSPTSKAMAEIKPKQRGTLKPCYLQDKNITCWSQLPQAPLDGLLRGDILVQHQCIQLQIKNATHFIFELQSCKYGKCIPHFPEWKMGKTRFMHSPVLLRITTSVPHHKHSWSDIQRWLTRHSKDDWPDTQRWLTRHSKDDWPDTQRWLARHKNDKLDTQRCLTRHTKMTSWTHKDGWPDTQRWLTRHTKMTSWTHKDDSPDTQRWLTRHTKWLTSHTKMTDQAHKVTDQSHKNDWPGTQSDWPVTQKWLTRHTKWLTSHTKMTDQTHMDDWSSTQWQLTRADQKHWLTDWTDKHDWPITQ